MTDRGISTVNGYTLPVLHNFSEPFTQQLAGFTHYLTADDVSCNVYNYIGLFPALIFFKLTEILHGESSGYLVASCCRNQAVNVIEINGWKFIKHQTAFLHSFFIYLPY